MLDAPALVSGFSRNHRSHS